jgi:hypothetical protein
MLFIIHKYLIGIGKNSESGVGVIKPIILTLLKEELRPNMVFVRDATNNSGALVV